MALTPFKSRLIADVGISFGDEGKGRLISEVVAELREAGKAPASTVLKVNGGANSGHTAGGLKLNLLPAGVVDADIAHLVIGSGVVADPRKFLWEGRPVEAKGYSVFKRLLIDERTLVSDLTHRLLDLAFEDYRINVLGEEPRGSTGRGITPAFGDETGQWQIYYADFLGPREVFARKLTQRADRAVRTIQHVCRISPEGWHGFFETLSRNELRANKEAVDVGVFPAEEFDFHRFRGAEPFTINMDALTEAYWQAGRALAANIGEVRELILRELRENRTVIGEFGQAYWLDKRQGFSPNVTASHTFTPELFQSAGIPLQPVHVIGVAKGYDTKVGTHCFITQIEEGHALGELLKKIEFGSTTGRQRMVGWFDAVEKGDALRYGGFHDLMINKTDALTHDGDWQGDLQICTAYKLPDGSLVHHVPRDQQVHRKLKAVYVSCPGWKEDITGARKWLDLPANAQRYVAMMMKTTLDVAYHGEARPENLPNLRYLGVGPLPSQIIKDIPQTADLLRIVG
jgi:adenylosuccinate synthase